MITIEPILISNCGKNRKVIQLNFEDEEWMMLEAFHTEAEQLRATKFVQEKQSGTINLTINRKSGVGSKAKSVDVEALSAMLHRARPFLLNDEQLYFFKVLNLMKRRTRHQPAFLAQFKAIQNHFNLSRMARFKAFGILGEIPTSPKVVMDWLNGNQYHRNQVKRDKLEKSLGIFGTDQNGAPTVIFALVDMIQAILYLSDQVENLIIAKDCEFEIQCPLELFE